MSGASVQYPSMVQDVEGGGGGGGGCLIRVKKIQEADS